MPRGDKSAYTDKQNRQAEHIEENYEHRGIPESEAERRAWATVNKETGGGKKSGSGRGKTTDNETVTQRTTRRLGRKSSGLASSRLPVPEGREEGDRDTQSTRPRPSKPLPAPRFRRDA